MLEASVSNFYTCPDCGRECAIIDDDFIQILPSNFIDNLIIVYDGQVRLPKMEYNQAGFSLAGAKNTIGYYGWKDVILYSIDGEIKKYNLAGESRRKALMESKVYAFDTWMRDYMDRNINVTKLPIIVTTNQDYENDLSIMRHDFLCN